MRSFPSVSVVLVLLPLAITACAKSQRAEPQPGSAAAAVVGALSPTPTAPVDDNDDDSVLSPKPASPTPVAAASGDACDAAIRHVSALLGETTGIPEEITRCRSERWRPEFLACMVQTPDLDTYASRCMKLLFSDADGLKVERVFAAGASRDGEPAAGKQDGDLVLYSDADRCGFLSRFRYPGEAVYLVCGNTVFAGPLTTPAEIEEVSESVLAQKRQAHDLRMSLMKQWPKFRTVRVYDSVGNDLGTEVR